MNANVAALIVAAVLIFQGEQVSRYERDLGSTDWKTRVQASHRLLVSKDIPLCRKLLQQSHDPEVRGRTQRAYEALRSETLESMKPYPRISALWLHAEVFPRPSGSGYSEIVKYNTGSPLAKRLMPLVDPNWHNQEFWAGGDVVRSQIPNEKYIAATRTWLGQQLDAGTPHWLLRMILWEMRRRDQIAGDYTPSHVYGR